MRWGLIVELRRGDHSGARLNMEQERLERERRLREIFGRAPKTPDEAATDGPESNPVNSQESAPIKLNQTGSNQIKPVEPEVGGPSVP
jgi:hypothetical protein